MRSDFKPKVLSFIFKPKVKPKVLRVLYFKPKVLSFIKCWVSENIVGLL